MFAVNPSAQSTSDIPRPASHRQLDRSRAAKPWTLCVRRNLAARTKIRPAAGARGIETIVSSDARRLPTKIMSSLPAAAAALSAATAVAAETAVDAAAYVPSALDDGDGFAQLVVVLVCAVCGMVGMLTSFDGEQAASEEALAEKVSAQVDAMRKAVSEPLSGVSAEQVASDGAAAASAFETQGVLRVDGAISPQTAAELLNEINATLERELSRAGQRGSSRGLPSESFGNVYCKGNRYDLKLPLDGVAAKALKEAIDKLRPFLEDVAGGERAKLCEFAALVSDPGSMRQPVHPDTNYRRDRCVLTSFVALQDVTADMGPTIFIPGSHTASAHLAFRDAGERGGPALAAPNRVATLSAGDATLFDSRLLHCGGGNESDRRRVLFYFSFEVDGSDNPNTAVSSIREELRGKYSLADL